MEVENDTDSEYKNVPGNRGGTISLETFKLVATNALDEHDAFLRKYEQQKAELEQVQACLKETEENLYKLSSVSQKACEEMVNIHDELETKVDVEQRCREEAESYASKMVKENKKILRENREIKRKSMAMLGKAGVDLHVFEISLDDIPDDPEGASPDESQTSSEQSVLIEELQYKVKDLSYQLEEAQKQMRLLDQEKDDALQTAHYYKQESSALIQQLALENTSHEVTKAALKEKENTLYKLNRVSTLVIQEFQDVSTKYEEATVLREQAETFAAQLHAEKTAADAVQRKSVLMLEENFEEGERIANLLDEVKQMTKTLEEERLNHKKELEEAQRRLTSSTDVIEHDSMREKLQLADDEMTTADKRIGELEERNRRLEKEIEDLKEAAKPAPPPPPPPPPPPQVPRNPLKILRSIIHRNKVAGSGSTAKKDPHQDQYNATIEEMMKRIKKGDVQLRSVNQHPMQRKGSAKASKAVQELDNILQNIQKSHGGKFTAIPPNRSQTDGSSQELTELEKIMLKRREKSSEKTSEIPEPSKGTEIPEPSTGKRDSGSTSTAPTQEPKTQKVVKDSKKVPVPAPRASDSSSLLYQEIQPKHSEDMVVEINPVYDSISETEIKMNGESRTRTPSNPPLPDPDDPSNVYSLVNN